MNFFEENINLIEGISGFEEAFQGIMKYEKFPKSTILHEAGNICDDFYIIISGIGRVFFYKEDKDITCHFAAENETMTAIDSFIQRKKSKYCVEALEDLEVFKISYYDLENLLTINPKFERFVRLFMQHAYVELAERIGDLQLNTAQERYEILMKKSPYLFKRVAAKHIASFLGISPETLSRIRAK